MMEQGDMFGGVTSKTPMVTGDPALFALASMLQAQGVSIERAVEKIDGLANAVAGLRETTAVLKSESQRDVALSSEVSALKAEVAALKLRNAQQDGGLKMATFVKDFAPWILAGLVAVSTYFK